MLNKLRNKKTAKKIWIILTVLILPAFLFWGFGSFLRDKQEVTYTGKIFGRKISQLEYKEALDAVRNQALIQFGDRFPEIEKEMNFDYMAWERLILLAEAKRRKIKANDQEIVELVRSYPFFQKKGKFDSQVYSQMLQYVFRAQPRIFEEQTRSNLMISKLYKEITKGVVLTDEEIKREYRRQNEQVDLYYIAAITNDFIKDLSVGEEEAKSYFSRNSFQFETPLSFNMEYVSIPTETQTDSAAKETIKKMAGTLDKNDDFQKAAKELGLETKETGFLSQADPIPGIGWSPQVLSLISGLKTGGFAPPVYIDKNYYIFRLKERKKPYIPEFESIKDKVKEELKKEKGKAAARQKIEDCLAELRSASKDNPKAVDFAKTAKNHGLKSDSTGLFSYGSYIENIGSSDIFFSVSLDLKEEAFSGIIEMPTGFYIIKLKSRAAIDEKKFTEEKEELSSKLLTQKKDEYFGRFFNDLKKRNRD